MGVPSCARTGSGISRGVPSLDARGVARGTTGWVEERSSIS